VEEGPAPTALGGHPRWHLLSSAAGIYGGEA
jgi:hypothetical protein